MIAVSPLLGWHAQVRGPIVIGGNSPPPTFEYETLWELAAAADVVITALGILTFVLAVQAMLRLRSPRMLATAAAAACCLVASSAWAAEYVRERHPAAPLLDHSGPFVVALGAIALLAGTVLWVVAARRGELAASRPATVGRVALLLAGAGAPTLILAAGADGRSLYEIVDVIDIVLTVLAVLVVAAAATLRRHRLIGRIAVVLGAGLAGASLICGLELLLVEQSEFFQSDGTGALLAFVVAPTAIVGVGLLGMSIARPSVAAPAQLGRRR